MGSTIGNQQASLKSAAKIFGHLKPRKGEFKRWALRQTGRVAHPDPNNADQTFQLDGCMVGGRRKSRG